MESNLAHIGAFGIKDDPPMRNNNVLNHAFGSRSYPALVENIRYSETDLKHKALKYLYDNLHKQENIYAAIQADLVPALLTSIRDYNETVREESAKVFSLLASSITARTILINQKALPALLHSLKDPSEVVRLYSQKTFTTFTMNKQGAQAAMDSGLVSELLKISTNLEELEIMIYLLESLHNCIKLDASKVLCLGGMKFVVAILQQVLRSSEDSENITKLKYLCAECLCGLCIPYDGKAEACESSNVIENLVLLTKDTNTNITTAALGALMNITVRVEGKWIAIKCGISTLLLEALMANNEMNFTYILKTIINICEDPNGRKELQPAIQQLQKIIKENRDESKVASAKIALSKLMM